MDEYKKAAPFRLRPRLVSCTERIPGYLPHAAGLQVLTPSGFVAAIENGNDPSAADTLATNQVTEIQRLIITPDQ